MISVSRFSRLSLCRVLLLLGMSCLFLPASVAQPVPTKVHASPTDLARAINAYLSQGRFANADWGISVVSLDNGKVLYQHRADKLAIPASNAKLYTAALALTALGPDFRTHTTLYATSKPRKGVIQGDLILYGRGDPTLGNPDDDFATVDWAAQMAQTLVKAGITRVHGSLIADDTWFAGPRTPAGWETGDMQTWYAPPASALTVQSNIFRIHIGPRAGLCCTVETVPAMPGLDIINLTQTNPSARFDDLGLYRPPGSSRLYVYGAMRPQAHTRYFALSAPDPALMAGHLLLQALSSAGIQVDGGVRTLHWPRQNNAIGAPDTVALADIPSPRLDAVVTHALKHSDNLYAQLLLLQVGVHTAGLGLCTDRPKPPLTSNSWALCAMRALLRRIDVAPTRANLAEGSGLSRRDLVTPAATTHLLAWIARQDFAQTFHDALPVAGVDGTLEYRLNTTVTEDNLVAKTGTLSHSYTLSGYVTDVAGKRLVFSLMLDDYVRPREPGGKPKPPTPQDDLDAIATIIANYNGK